MSSIDEDAREYGVHVRHGGWRLGLLVARSVEKGTAGRPSNRRDRDDSQKISASEFARRAETSADRVLRHLSAWEKAAAAGWVPRAETLRPGQEVALPDVLKWDKFYEPVSGGRLGSKPEDAVTIIERRGVVPVVEVMPAPMRSEVYTTIGRLLEEEHRRERVEPARDEQRIEVGILLMSVLKADQRLHDALDALKSGEVEVGLIDDDDRQRLHNLIERIRRALDLIDMAAGGGVDDAALEAWLSEGAS